MPTGYTAQLMEMNFDVKRWLKERVVRGVGVCALIREECSLNEEGIRKAICKENKYSLDYYSTGLNNAIKELDHYLNMTESEWESYFEKEIKTDTLKYSERVSQYNENKSLHEKALNECNRMLSLSNEKNESVFNGTLLLAINQLNIVIDSDYREIPQKPYALSIPDYKKMKEDYIFSAKNTIAYYEEKIKKERSNNTRSNNHLEEYNKFVSLVDNA